MIPLLMAPFQALMISASCLNRFVLKLCFTEQLNQFFMERKSAYLLSSFNKFLLIRIVDHLICLLRNLYAGQEATVGTGHGPIHWFRIGKGVRQGCILSPCLFNFYAEYIMRNAGLEEVQAGIKVAGRNINNLR